MRMSDGLGTSTASGWAGEAVNGSTAAKHVSGTSAGQARDRRARVRRRARRYT
jgi:hypothetical protein